MRLLFALIVFAASAFSPVLAQRIPLTKEPGRYALIIGNADYKLFRSSFEDVTPACDEALNFRQKLLDIGWSADNISPKLTDGSRANDRKYLRSIYCNLTNDRIRSELASFQNDRLDGQDNPYSVIYYAGHGAQNQGETYIFGVDATVDPLQEFRRVSQMTGYPIFNQQAVNINNYIKQMDGLRGRATLLLINACRDDPILQKYRDAVDDLVEKATPPIPRTTLDALSITYGRQIQTHNFSYFRSVIAYSTLPGETAKDYGKFGAELYAKTVLDLLDDEDMLQDGTSSFADELVSRVMYAQANIAESSRQYAEKQGAAPKRPIFCFKGCAQPLSVWEKERAQIFLPMGANQTENSAPPPANKKPVRKSEFEPPYRTAALRKLLRARPTEFAAIGSTFGLNATSVIDKTEPTAEFAASDEQETMPSSPVPSISAPSLSIDIFYCVGDEHDGDRLKMATELATEITQSTSQSYTLAGSRLGFVRLRELTAAVNRANNFVYGGSSMWIDSGTSDEKAWADYVNQKTSHPLRVATRKQPHKSKNYISIFLCDGAEKIVPKSLVFTQVPTQEDKKVGQVLNDLLSTKVSNVTFADGIEAVDSAQKTRSPEKTEVRFFENSQKAQADALAGEISAATGKPVSSVKLKDNTGNIQSNPVIELWIGRQDLSAYDALMK